MKKSTLGILLCFITIIIASAVVFSARFNPDILKRDSKLQNQGNRVIRLNQKDNVVVALENLSKGATVKVADMTIRLTEPVQVKHKIAIADLAAGDSVYQYGLLVGTATKSISKGAAITTGNIKNSTGEIKRDKKRDYRWTPPGVEAFRGRTFNGYHRADGQVGTGNYWLVIPLVFCENRNAEMIKDAMLYELGYQSVSPYRQFTRELISLYQKGATEEEIAKIGKVEVEHFASESKVFKNVSGIMFLTHEGGCGGTREDATALCGLLAGYITHSNVAGATILSLGCQNAQLSILQEEIKKRDPDFSKPYYELDQQTIGTAEEMIRMAIQSTFTGLMIADKIERKPAPLSKLCVGLECGGSDGFSGISANPAIGYVSDLIVALGGSTILSEFPELSGVEQDLYDRCVSQADGERFLELMRVFSLRAKEVGSGFEYNPSPGNIRDGLITDAMKSAGAALKGGTAPIAGVLDFPEKVMSPGFYLLCTPGGDVESTTAEVGSGANVLLFTTGLGTPTGNPVTPVIKISSNTMLYEKMPDIIDINAGTIIDGKETIEQAGERILNYIIEVASGEKVPASVRNGQHDFIPWKRGVSL